MSTKSKSIVNLKSSEKLANFLIENRLHKKDFAQMVGVTLSYVYNLIDNAIPFSTRSTTLERIAVVMDISPEEFIEYKIPQEPLIVDEALEFLREKIKSKKMTTLQFLKAFPRKKRLEIVDILRGARPIPLNWEEIENIAQILDISKEEIYVFWESRLRQVLTAAGFNFESNKEFGNTLLNCCRKFIEKT